MKKMLLLLIPWCLIGCDGKPPDVDTSVVRTSKGPDVYINTVTHDGHKLLVCSSGRMDGGVSMMHHPACECLKAR